MGQNNIFAGLSYLLGWIVALIVFVVAKDDKFARFHALQSILWTVVYFVAAMASLIVAVVCMFVLGIVGAALNLGGITAVLTFVPFALPLLVMLAAFLYWLWAMIQAFTGKWYKLPFIGNFAESHA
ncbi:MAG: DUF4870 domain-containing protein [Candidatus ainarchaeum sp.]|nr:DUF4870 domain-containing protein [Candidatus ainarchaeum sp.]